MNEVHKSAQQKRKTVNRKECLNVQNVKRDLTTDRVGEAKVGKLLLQELDELGADLVLLQSISAHISGERVRDMGPSNKRKRTLSYASNSLRSLTLFRGRRSVLRALAPLRLPQTRHTRRYGRWGRRCRCMKGQQICPDRTGPGSESSLDHAVTELDERSSARAKEEHQLSGLVRCTIGNVPLDGDVEVGDVVQDEPDELLVLFLAEPLDKALRLELLAETDRRQAVLGKAKVKVVGDCRGAFSANNVRVLNRERRGAN